jgi:hypothetical protein
MQVLILEVIATSGKSSTINGLLKSLPKYVNARVFTEQFTHIPIKDKTNDLCNEFFIRLIAEAFSKNYDLVVFDRLYLTQAHRTNSALNKYLDVEMLLLTHPVETVFLRVDEAEISNRLAASLKQRDAEWKSYVATKGASLKEQAKYYTDQQDNLLKLLLQSRLPYEIYDTTRSNYHEVATEIKKKVLVNL